MNELLHLHFEPINISDYDPVRERSINRLARTIVNLANNDTYDES